MVILYCKEGVFLHNNKFDIRILFIFIMVTLLMFVSVLRLYKISTDSKIAAKQYTNHYRIKLSNIRGSIFDKDLNAITNNAYKYIAVVSPTSLGIAAISEYLFEDERLTGVINTLKSGRPAVLEVDRVIDSPAIECVKVFENDVKNYYPSQLIGYVNSENKGVSGIQSAYDELLFSNETIDAAFAVDTLGNVLDGVKTEIIGDMSLYKSGVALTIDSALQKATYKAMQSVVSGAAVVSEIGTGKIRAMVSIPNFDIKNVGDYLDKENSPLINRALSAYNVGSAFKPCVAAALLEKGADNYVINCLGSTYVDSHKFNCHNKSGHGWVNLKDAITKSCNVFFYNISGMLGGDEIYNYASIFGFGKEIDLGGIKTAKGNITSRDTLKNSNTALANLSIGQGELLLSPVSMLPLYEAIANDGVYYMPTIIEGVVNRGVLNNNKRSSPTYALSKNTAQTLKNYLINVVQNGTGSEAQTNSCTVAGKTATAETGWRKNGQLIQNSWFCGFFPADNPKYVAVVLIEDQETNGTAAAPIFKKIVEEIMQLA